MLVLADDLSGAAETAALLAPRTGSARVVLSGPGVRAAVSAGVTVVDLDTRHADAAVTDAAVRDAVAGTPGAAVLVKLDSLLRGPVAAAVGAVGPVVVATALPALDRVVRNGVPVVSGGPLSGTPAWATEGRTAPSSLAQALAPLLVQVVPLADVRSSGLPDLLRSVLASGRVPVCDGESDADLDAVAAAVAGLPGVALAGSAGLAAAVGRRLGHAPLGGVPTPVPDRTGGPGPLVVVGTAEGVALGQVAGLRAGGVPEVLVPVPDLLAAVPDAGVVRRLADAVTRGAVVLRPDPAGGVVPGAGRHLSAGLARLVSAALAAVPGGPVDLALTGGETARRVLDGLGVRTLAPRATVHHGAVVCTAPDGRSVVTRPGSFGGPGSLLAILTALTGEVAVPSTDQHPVASGGTTEGPSMSTLTSPTEPVADSGPTPFIAVTMGDGAGVGPEVVVGALVDPASLARCRPVVIGDAARLRAAAEILGLDAEIAVVERVADAVFTPGRINVIDLGLLPADLPWGRLSPVAGHAAYEYIRVAAELAMAGEVQGICTAPLNKEALHAAGHVYPGHTELLAHFCGIEEVSMMLSSPRIRVIHVTTHLGLIDAINRIEPGLVERTVRRGHDALVRAGIPNPRISVCGINPHAGENGLFGYGEEEEKIVPAIERLQADGIDVRGPLPADTAFFVAGRGDYDLVVAMYHDQGHGPVKVLGIEAGVNITVGLPVIRTSVDHGTAFDIAGTGKVEIGSMIEALRQAAQMSPRPAA
ncbi:4-hydroxythreonine-4-phosphate dehydrogenase PdxA [Modestobacter muralis]|uniref:4-hydroxythreonine-4-phosphate dehydrogenase PdxA n=1 Tax=Modestobacter muralis TaxID=1608614 RepID=A0A6P0H7U8_9ACTN|nr:4-hydroxythreonine-4-phosphate dehydrogenase PdxA [Modestobacter muralis]NEN51229.1 4-hydroxythreonine-4-phosphate dehydrogenase PdxA [Modestobacter muralis]